MSDKQKDIEVVEANVDEDEVVIKEVAGPNASNKQVQLTKNSDAKWVTGLRPERYRDPKEELEAKRMAENPWAGKGHWLRGPLNIGLFAVLIMLFRLSFTSIPGAYSLGLTDHHAALAPMDDFYLQLEYPETEVPAWKLAAAMTPVDYAVLASYPLVTAAFTGSLCLNFAVATESFVNFIGVGFSVVGVLAELGDVVLLHASCYGKEASPGSNQCFLPLSLHWILATFACVCPIIGMMTVSYVFDELLYRVDMKDDWWEMTPYWRRFNKWFWITLAPLLVHMAHWADCYWNNKSPQHGQIRMALVVQLVVWCLVIWRCNKQNPFVVHWQLPKKGAEKKAKVDPEILKKKKED